MPFEILYADQAMEFLEKLNPQLLADDAAAADALAQQGVVYADVRQYDSGLAGRLQAYVRATALKTGQPNLADVANDLSDLQEFVMRTQNAANLPLLHGDWRTLPRTVQKLKPRRVWNGPEWVQIWIEPRSKILVLCFAVEVSPAGSKDMHDPFVLVPGLCAFCN